MATQWTAGLSALTPLPAATLNTIGAAWETWTPAWTSSGTQPALNNGTISGRYTRINKLVVAQGILSVGSTTTFGTGGYFISIPVTAQNTNGYAAGFAVLLDASAGFTRYSGVAWLASTTTLEINVSDGVGQWQPTVPITLANGDQVRFAAVYEAA